MYIENSGPIRGGWNGESGKQISIFQYSNWLTWDKPSTYYCTNILLLRRCTDEISKSARNSLDYCLPLKLPRTTLSDLVIWSRITFPGRDRLAFPDF